MSKESDLLPRVAFSILLALSLKERHGYEIIQQVDEDSNGHIKLGPGALYTSIKQLRKKNLIEEVRKADDSRRRYYKLTGAGQRVLEAELEYYQTALTLAHQRQVLLGAGHHAAL
jgi:DNA-binding PadR family transcriptional regulator